MKIALLLFAALAACKPTSSAQPAGGSAAPAPVARDRNRGPGPALPPPGQAQAEPEEAPRPPRSKMPWLDKNGDGVVTDEERATAAAERAARFRDRFDVNHDGKLTPDELAQSGSGGRGLKFDDPKSVDINGDGEISPDELQEGIREQRLRRHALELNAADQ